jgi:hypothetical protein
MPCCSALHVAFSRPPPPPARSLPRPDRLFNWRTLPCPSPQLLVHSALTCMGLAAVWGQPWLLDTTLLWEGWPGHELT